MKIRFDKCEWANLNTYDIHASYYLTDDLHHIYNNEWHQITGFLVDYKHDGLTDPLNSTLMEFSFYCYIPEGEEPAIFRKQLKDILEPQVRKMAAEDTLERLNAWKNQVMPVYKKKCKEYDNLRIQIADYANQIDEINALIEGETN